MGETIAASGLTALVLVTAGITALWRAFINGNIVSGKTYDATAGALKTEQEGRKQDQDLVRQLTAAIERRNDGYEKLIELLERRAQKSPRSRG